MDDFKQKGKKNFLESASYFHRIPNWTPNENEKEAVYCAANAKITCRVGDIYWALESKKIQFHGTKTAKR